MFCFECASYKIKVIVCCFTFSWFLYCNSKRMHRFGVSECGFLTKKLIDSARVIASCAKSWNLSLAYRYTISCNHFLIHVRLNFVLVSMGVPLLPDVQH